MVTYLLKIEVPEDHPEANLLELLRRFEGTLDAAGYPTEIVKSGPLAVTVSTEPLPDGAVVEYEEPPPKKAKKNAR